MDKLYKSILFLIAFCGTFLELLSQQPVIQQFTPSEGLPSTAIYDIVQDERGYIWLATDNGLSRYNGIKFENFSLEDGLADRSAIHFSQGRRDTIWCMGYNGTVSLVVDGDIFADTSLNKILADNLNSYVDKIYFDSIGRYWIAPRFGGLMMIDRDGSANWIYDHEFTAGVSYILLKDFGDQCLMAVVEPPAEVKQELPDFYHSGNEYFIRVNSIVTHLHRNVIRFAEGDYLVAYFKHLFRIKDDQVVKHISMDQRIVDIAVDHDGHLWVSHFTAGVKKFAECNLDAEPDIFFKTNTITRIFEDAEQILWFASANNGLYRISSFEFLVFPIGAGNTRYSVTSLDGGGDKVFFSTYNQRVYELDLSNEDLSVESFYKAPIDRTLHDILVENDSFLWIFNTDDYRYLLDGTPSPVENMISSLIIEPMVEGGFVTASQFNMYIWKNGKLARSVKRAINGRILCLHEDRNGTIWVGTIRGLYQDMDGKIEQFRRLPDPVDDKITSICSIKEDIVVSKGSGEILIIGTDTVYSILSGAGRGFGNVNRMVADQDSILWIGTDNGLVRISLHGGEPYQFDVVTYHIGDGLSSDKITDLIIYKDQLWLGTNRGLMVFNNRGHPKISKLPKVYITRMLLNDQQVDIEGPLIFAPQENNIRIEFQGISQRGAGNIKYRYRLWDHDPERIVTENLYAYFPNLDPGEYRFFVNAGNSDGHWNEVPVSLDFTIEKPFTQTVGFLVLMLLGVIFTLAIILLILNRFQKRRNALKQNLVLMQQRLLRTQMNPHFVFNSLLAIQSFMYKNDPKEAGVYLSRFARLIRLILDSSRKDMIPLEEELKYLEYYLDLQKLRFRNAFDYTIEVAQNIHPDRVLLPPMLAQPFIENAIEHGMRDLDYKGMIKISFSCTDSELVFNVEDNGIGISKAEKIKLSKAGEYESLGQRITVDRLRLLSKTHGHKVTFTIEENMDDDGNARGTSVWFYIKYKDGIDCR